MSGLHFLWSPSGDVLNYCLSSGHGSFGPWSLDNSSVAFIGLINHRQELIILEVESGNTIITDLDACQTPICDHPSDMNLGTILGWIL